jgi:hypothetical protein
MGAAVRRAGAHGHIADSIRARRHECAHRERPAARRGRDLRGSKVHAEQPGIHQDYEKVNELLASVEAEIRRSFLTEVEKSIDDHLEPVAHLIASWNIDNARDFAWLTAQTLWELRRAGPLLDAYVATLARTVGMGSRLLLTCLT